ncbi:uncharacterized protein LOC114362910 [Ostrinia furnacalis]|uniref:uncharacterized protein LOC114362910 n=1 Tax=Ostrinia furnacalis TaxID=93504 RepID=UPI00103EAB89|nr:uncharacterized protein LOC114362910 [Ostrinia furnacalis]XP_028174293.1 uncharacterized protein LOC114362910 [Ostrinia furnacalis]
MTMRCMSCNIKLEEETQYYNVGDIGAQLIALIARTLNCEIDLQAYLCEECFTSFTQKLYSEARSHSNKHDSIIHCVWCKKSINGRRSHSLPNGPERRQIALRILPIQIQPGNRVCYACWLAARRLVQRSQQQAQNRPEASVQDSSEQPPILEPETSASLDPHCVRCGRNIAGVRSQSLPEGRERDNIARYISPRQIEPNGRVCYACWVAARRSVRKEEDNEKREIAGAAIDIPSGSCTILPNYRRTANSSNSCFVRNCNNAERFTVPLCLRLRLLKSYKLYVTDNARVCQEHLSADNWDFIDDHNYIHQFSPTQIEQMINMSIK